MKVELIMISNLKLSGGGRETWLNNFLTALKQYKNSISSIEIHSLDLAEENLVKEHSNFIKSITYKRKILFLPILVNFIVSYIFTNLFKKKNVDKYIAVGGLDEMIALLFGNFFYVRKSQRIVWLRSIYSLEKASSYPKWLVKILFFFEIFLLRYFFGKIIANGYDTAFFYKKLGLDVDVIPNSIFIEDWAASYKKNISDVLNVAYIGRITKIKGFDNFVKSIDEINKVNNGRVLFHIIGDGNDRALINNKENVKYYGAVSNKELPKIVYNIDVCVALTVFDDNMGGAGISNALLEHMASKKVIICWDNQIFRQILDCDSAYFVKQNDVEQLRKTILYIANNREEASKKADLAYEAVLKFSMENHVKLFNDLIREV
jgi:glycosyltransferase involved in cell wall biosynthesis